MDIHLILFDITLKPENLGSKVFTPFVTNLNINLDLLMLKTLHQGDEKRCVDLGDLKC